MKIITFNESCKRLTVRTTPQAGDKLTRMSKSTEITKEEIMNILIMNFDWEKDKEVLLKYRQEIRLEKERRRQAERTLANMDTKTLSKLGSLSPEQIEALLSKV